MESILLFAGRDMHAGAFHVLTQHVQECSAKFCPVYLLLLLSANVSVVHRVACATCHDCLVMFGLICSMLAREASEFTSAVSHNVCNIVTKPCEELRLCAFVLPASSAFAMSAAMADHQRPPRGNIPPQRSRPHSARAHPSHMEHTMSPAGLSPALARADGVVRLRYTRPLGAQCFALPAIEARTSWSCTDTSAETCAYRGAA